MTGTLVDQLHVYDPWRVVVDNSRRNEFSPLWLYNFIQPGFTILYPCCPTPRYGTSLWHWHHSHAKDGG